MSMAHDIGPLYVQLIPYPLRGLWPLVEVGETNEIEPPYRTGRALVIRIPGKRAIVIGLWRGGAGDEERSLRRALRMREIDGDDWRHYGAVAA